MRRPSKRFFFGGGVTARALFGVAALVSLASVAHPAVAAVESVDEDDPKPRVIDPGVGSGPLIVYAARPASSSTRVCSTRTPICVHPREPGAKDNASATDILAAFDRAWSTLRGALDIAPPDVNPSTLTYDVYLAAPLEGGELASTRLEARDVRSRVDRGRAFTEIDRRMRAGCMLDLIATQELARASLYREAPATEEATARAQSRYLAELVVPCGAALTADAVQAFQSNADRTFCDAHAGEDDAMAGGPSSFSWGSASASLFARGASLFWSRIDWAFGRKPGILVPASWALHPTMTPVAAPRWLNEPDTFDVLRMTFKGTLSTNSTAADLWLDFGVARAFVGANDDGWHQPELRTLGEAARVPIDWDIPWPKTARRFAARRPVRPLGASYLVIHHEGARPGARLRVEIEWEEHALFRWAFVKIDASGRETGRVLIPTTERATTAQMTLVDVDSVDRVMLVGVNVGDPAYAFDPDDEVWEPHGWLVTVAEE